MASQQSQPPTPYCSHCGFYGPLPDGICPNCNQPSKSVAVAAVAPAGAQEQLQVYISKPPHARSSQPPPQPPQPRYTYDSVSIIIRVAIVVIILLLFILPQTRPYAMEALRTLEVYLNAGLEHYMEMPDYAEFVVHRILTIRAPTGYEKLTYNLTIMWPLTITLKGKEVQRYGEDGVTYTITGNGPKPIYVGDGSKMEWCGTLYAGESVKFDIRYHMITTTLIWDINVGNTDTIDAIPEELLDSYMCDRWWQGKGETPDGKLLYGDLDGDGKIDQEFEDEVFGPDDPRYRNGKLDRGEDLDNDGHLDIDEDLNDDGKGDCRIMPTAPAIRELAEKLTAGKRNVYMALKSIFDYMREHIAYPTEAQMAYDAILHNYQPKTALETLRDAYGDCDDQSILFISLCCAAGIPAWLESGVLYDPRQDLWCGHGWVRVYIPLKSGDETWANVDVVNNMFLKRDCNRFSDWTDDGSRGTIDDYYTLWLFSNGGEIETTDSYSTEFYAAHESEIKIRV